LFCGTPCDQESMHIFSGSKGFEFFSPSQLMMGGISVNRDNLLQQLTAEEQEIVLQRSDEAQLIKLDSNKISSFGGFMAGVFEMVQANPALLERTSTRASLNRTVTSLLTECLLENSAVNEKPISNEKCWSIIGQTRELVAQQSEAPISVAELCRHLGVSRRTLQYCFTNMLGTSPVVYLRTERLNNVRRMLRTANSVTEAAAHWGFWHFGHFSQEYKRMFGELPSTTFKRMRNLN
jgi:AraC family ethanolamine operon transcriptional activator